MGEEGEKTCPLCAEEMDLTDQQLKPCKCGYEICVWCWHHIMDMAEKDSTEGRCPACRTPYDKERIVGTTVNCERLVSEINSERRLKSQKAKPKASDGRKHLGSQRVIQRNLVYINGIPAGLADEDALQRKEYFGQYGKVLKVSISRTAGGAIQYSPNNTCSVYITYSKEEEAVRCIQSVHGFVLEDKSLRACFGTTKYCHAWLRNMPCNNPECLYLHEVGIQEDSFDKDEIVSAFARSKAQQNAGATNNLQLRRSGNVLPPPADDFASSSTGSSEKLIIRTVPNTTPSHVRGSPPNGATGKSAALPAAASWGLRCSNGRSQIASSSCSDGPSKQSHDTPLVTDAAKKPIANEVTHAAHLNGKQVLLELSKKSIVTDCQSTAHDTREEAVQDSYPSTWPSISKSNSSSISAVPNAAKSVELVKELRIGAADLGGNIAADKSQSLCARLSSINIGNDSPRVDTNDVGSNASVYNQLSFDPPGIQDLQHHQQLYNEHVRKPSVSEASSSHTSRETVRSEGWVSDSQRQVLPVTQIDRQEDVHEFDGRSLNAIESNGNSRYLPNSSILIGSYGQSWQGSDTFSAVEHGYKDPITVRSEAQETLLRSTESESNGYYGNKFSSAEDMTNNYQRSDLSSYGEVDKETGNFGYDTSNAAKSTVDWGESSIISNILAMDFDTWDTSLASPQNLAKILSQSDKEHKIPNAWRAQNNNQSRFSFARQDDYGMQGPDSEPSSSNNVHADRYTAAKLDFVTNGDLYMDKRRNGSLSSIIEDSYNLSRGISNMPNDKLSVSRGQISAPPGFSVPSRAPPPGFSHDRMDQTFDALPGSRFLENSSMLRNQYQSHSTGNLGIVEDVEYYDPAIITAREGLPNGIHNSGLDVKSTFAPQLSASENDLRLQLLMQQSISANQNLMFSNHIRDRFPPMGDAYNSIPSMHLEQSPFVQSSLQSRNGPISNGNGWNEIQNGNELGMAELLRNDRLGYNNYFSGYEDLKYQIPSSGDLYSRAFGM